MIHIQWYRQSQTLWRSLKRNWIDSSGKLSECPSRIDLIQGVYRLVPGIQGSKEVVAGEFSYFMREVKRKSANFSNEIQKTFQRSVKIEIKENRSYGCKNISLISHVFSVKINRTHLWQNKATFAVHLCSFRCRRFRHRSPEFTIVRQRFSKVCSWGSVLATGISFRHNAFFGKSGSRGWTSFFIEEVVMIRRETDIFKRK